MAHRRHAWDGDICVVCKRQRDPIAAQRSRSAVRLGKDAERRLAKKHGWKRVGQFGDAVDLLDADLLKVQSKATRNPVPAYLWAVNSISPIEPYSWVTGPLEKMSSLYPERVGLLVLSYVRAGVATSTYYVIRYEDFVAIWGADWLPPLAVQPSHLVMAEWYFKEVYGQ